MCKWILAEKDFRSNPDQDEPRDHEPGQRPTTTNDVEPNPEPTITRQVINCTTVTFTISVSLIYCPYYYQSYIITLSMTSHQYWTFRPSCHNLLYLRPSNSPHFSFVTDEDLRGPNVLHIDSIATCSLETDHLFTLHRSMSLYKINA